VRNVPNPLAVRRASTSGGFSNFRQENEENALSISQLLTRFPARTWPDIENVKKFNSIFFTCFIRVGSSKETCTSSNKFRSIWRELLSRWDERKIATCLDLNESRREVNCRSRAPFSQPGRPNQENQWNSRSKF